jgi:hypothetical protein
MPFPEIKIGVDLKETANYLGKQERVHLATNHRLVSLSLYYF